jgi:2,4-dienoyl-CoA reductase [(3E)-enoyl-CoA-producing], peroxisomal
MAGRTPTSPFRAGILAGKVALVTGGGSGIGYEVARQLGLHGAKLVLMGRREAPLHAAVSVLAAENVQAAFATGDVRNAEDCARIVAAAIQKYGRLDILVNNAAGNFLVPAEDLRPKGFRTVLEIDTIGVFNMCHAAFPELKRTGDALVINISATLHYGATWYQVHASAAKAAIDSVTRTLGLEWGEYGIRIVGIAPGPIAETAGMTKLSGGTADDFVAQYIPLKRMGTKGDIALTAVFLASEAGGYITGETIVVDGGQWLFRPPMAPRDFIRDLSRGIEKESRETGIPDVSKAKL